MGNDCIAMGSGWLNAAFTQLRGQNECIIGPSTDGGCALLGLSRLERLLFQDMTWGSKDLSSCLTAKARKAKISSSTLPAVDMVNDEKSWDQAMQGAQGAALKKAL